MLLSDQFRLNARRFAGRTALCAAGRSFSYGRLDASVQALAERLAAAGVREGERVGIDLGNQPAAVVAIWATLRTGAAFACLDPTTPHSGWSELVADFRPRVVLTRRARLLEGPPPAATTLLVETSAGDDPLPGVESFDLDAEPGGRSFGRPAAAGEQPANLVYTSGSTGIPKAVVMSQRAVASAAAAIISYLRLDRDDVILAPLPLSFDYGLYQVLLSGLTGACLVLEPNYSYPGSLLTALRAHGVTTLPGVPPLYQMLLQRPSFEGESLPSLRRFTNTGAHLPPRAVAELRRRFPSADVVLMYGLTECKRVSYLPPGLVDAHPDSVGIPMPGCQVEIVDDAGRPLGPGRVGELVVRGPHLMSGYWERPSETARALRAGPWPDEACLWTGDLFYRDREGLLYFVGRTDDIFKSRGEKVSPAEVERALLRHPGVAEAAVVPAPDPVMGARPHAFVVMVEGDDSGMAELRRHCQRVLEPYKRPHRFHRVTELPRNDRGKIDRAVLTDLASHAVDPTESTRSWT